MKAVIILATILLLTVKVNCAIIYIKYNATGANNGTSWANAYTSFQSGLDAAVSGDQIWVAKGTYKPSSAYDLTNTSRYYHFRMKNGVAIYGGFAGTETAVAQRADFGLGGANETILSGDLNGDDVVTGTGATLGFSNNGENCYHVFYHPASLALNNTAMLDGFTISGGNANGYGYPEGYGGGICSLGGGATVFVNLIISHNYADCGGGMFIISGSATITNTLIVNNASLYGGGICNNQTIPNFNNVTIAGNHGLTGGGICHIYGNAILNNCIIWDNYASDPNNTGHQIALMDNNCRLTMNYSCYANEVGDVYIDDGIFTATNNNITTNPKFVNSSEGDYRIVGNSPCINTGSNGYNATATDLRGAARIQNTTIDRGAYEWTSGTDPTGLIIYVNHDATGANNGSSWTNAYTSFQSGLNAAVSGDQIWVAKGTYKPSSAYDLTNTSRYYHFRMKNGVAIYGGFAGNETAVSQRADFGQGGANETILSGDLNGDDVVTGAGATLSFSNNGENCHHVFYHPNGLGLTSSAILDGFTITGGCTSGGYPYNPGGGINNYSSSPTLSNLTITENYSIGTGGGIYNYLSSPTLTNITISKNMSVGRGGGMHIDVSSTSICLNVVIINNNSLHSGGGVYNEFSSPTFNNCTMSNNSAPFGGGIFSQGTSLLILNNCIIFENTASQPTNQGNQIYINSGTTTLNNSCYSNGTGDVYSFGTFTATNNNINIDPMFVNSAAGDFRIYGISPCADAGNDSYNSLAFDIRGAGFERKLNKLTGSTGTIDMGAYEYKYGSDPYAPCINPTNGGLIENDQILCNGDSSDEITNSILPTGYSGNIEYQWQKSITNNTTGFEDILAATSENYQPETLTETTWFKRLSRVDCMSDWSGAAESNVIQITVNPTYSFTESHSICEGETYNWQGTDYTETNTYIASYLTVNGCDSIYTLNLTVNPVYSFTEIHSICQGETYNWQGTDYTEANTYIASYLTVNGCDSIYTLNLTVNPVYTFTENHNICEGETYTWQGSDYTETNTYTANYLSVNGCDSIYTLNLTVNPVYAFTENHSICQGETYTWQGLDYTEANTYTASYLSVNGCDSIYTLNLTVNPVYAFTENHSICEGETYNWQGTDYTEANTYTASYLSLNGCDSIYTLNLTVNPVYSFSESHSICEGETYTWQGTDYTEANTYTASYLSVNGCDSIYTLNLTVNPVYTYTENHSICQGETYTWQGSDYTEANTYTASYLSVNGCDSIYTLNLTVNPVYEFTESATICDNESYFWQGENYGGVSDVITVNYISQFGCDSIYTLNLTVNPTYTFEEMLTICEDETFDWQGETYTSGGYLQYQKDYESVFGCDSIYILHMNINELPVVSFTGLEAQYCNNNTAVQMTGDPEGGVFSGTGVSGTEFNPTVAGPGSWEIVYTYSDLNECENFASQTVLVDDCSGIENEIARYIQVYPNPNSGDFVVKLPRNENLQIVIYDAIGQIVRIIDFTDFDSQDISVTGLVPGAYVLNVVGDKIQKNIKIIVK